MIIHPIRPKIILILFSILFCFVACEKEQQDDYRDKYVGDYKFEITYSDPIYIWVDSLQTGILIWSDSTYYYSGFIKKSLKVNNRVLIHWGIDTLTTISDVVYIQSNEMIVDSSGVLSYPEYSGGGHTHFYPPAYLRNDSAIFNFGMGGIGSWVTWDVIGVKK